MLLIGLARVGGYLAGWDGGPDQLLFRAALDREAARAGLPNRMSPNTAAAFVLVGLALMLLDARTRRRGIRPAQFLALAAGLIALLALIGYAYSATSLIGVKQFIPMALNTAIAFAILSVGILCARPDRGVMRVVSSDGAGGAMARRLLPASILIPAFVGWASWLAQQRGISNQVMAMSLFVLANIVLFTALIWWNAASLERMDRERRRAERRLEVQYTASLALAGSPRLDDAVPALLRAICDSLGWSEGALWRVDPQAGVLRCGACWHSPSSRHGGIRGPEPADHVRPRGRAAGPRLGERPVGLDPGRRQGSQFPEGAGRGPRGLHGALGFPIVVGRDVLGVMEVFSGEIQQPDDELLQMLTAIGSQVGQLIKRKRRRRSSGAQPAPHADGDRPGLDLFQGRPRAASSASTRPWPTGSA